MSLRQEAREFAEDAYTKALDGLFQLIENRIEWRRANAHLLALEAERMVVLLKRAPSPVAFRKLKIRIWSARARKHAARAWANDHALAEACQLCRD